MTGFARVRRSMGDGELIVSVKTVNHRALDVQVHAASSIDPLEGSIRALLKSKLARGHVDVRVLLTSPASNGSGVAINKALLEGYLAAFRESAAAYGVDSKPDLNAALRLPGMFTSEPEAEESSGLETALLPALEAALNELNSFREREGAEIAADIRAHNAQIASTAADMERIRLGATAAFQARLTERLRDLLKGAPVDPQRLVQEAAILADRSDIGEELARLKIHSAQLNALLEAGGEVGKKLDFLLQEMNRETNTVLSKTSGAGEPGLRITELGLSAKAAIEKIREQSLNLE